MNIGGGETIGVCAHAEAQMKESDRTFMYPKNGAEQKKNRLNQIYKSKTKKKRRKIVGPHHTFL